MGVLPPTPTLGLVLPDPGTGQPFSTATQNGWFQTIDTAFDADRDRLALIEPVTLASGTRPGVVPSGTSAQRDTFWGIPGDAPARVALAGKAARWFNTEKGWEEQYFAQFDDAGAVPRLSAQTPGWKALGRQLVHAPTLTPTGGTAVDQGAYVLCGGAMAGLLLQGIFTDDFDDYEIEVQGAGPNVISGVGFRVATGAVLETGAALYGNNRVTIGNASVVGSYATSNVGNLGDLGNTGTSVVKAKVFNPKQAKQTLFIAEGHNMVNGQQVRASGQVGNTNSYDGFWINAGTSFAGTIKVYGIGR